LGTVGVNTSLSLAAYSHGGDNLNNYLTVWYCACRLRTKLHPWAANWVF